MIETGKRALIGKATEEFPLAEKELKREDNKWVLRTTIHSLRVPAGS